MRRYVCVCNLDTPLVCARRHQRVTMKCAYSSVELQCRHTVRHHRRASLGLVDVKLRKQIMCNPRLEREIKLMRL